jgi:hypothetical protein
MGRVALWSSAGLCVVLTLLCASCASQEKPLGGEAPDAAATSTPAPAATPVDNSPYPAGALGYAISWPQCGAQYPEAPFGFGIIGITNGQALTRNPCFEDEYRWAERGRYHPSIYLNVDYKEQAADFPACGGDAPCLAYRYGQAVAQDAYAYARSAGAVAPVWWLDVQIVSDWSADSSLNAIVIRSVADYLWARGIRIGISSTAFQWAAVAGDAQHNLPVWDASAVDTDQAALFCREGKDFGGGRTEQIAYVAAGFETVLACGEAASGN